MLDALIFVCSSEHWIYCCSTIAYKCRTISLSQYTFNQFWKHFYLFSLAFIYECFFFVSRPSQSRLQATLFHFCWFPLVLYVFRSVVGCLHFISLHVYLLWFCLALLCFLLWHDVYCWVHARNQYSILIVLYGEFVIIAYTTIPHITASYTPMLFWTLVVRAVSIAVCLFYVFLFFTLFFQASICVSCFSFSLFFFSIVSLRFSITKSPFFSDAKQIACVLCEYLHISWE